MKIRVIGGGIAGCTATRLLLDAGHNVELHESASRLGGFAFDGNGYQEYGPHIIHTDDEEVWRFLCRFDEMHEFTHRVFAMQPAGLIEIPRRGDPICDVYNAKAWPVVPDGAKARYKALPSGYDGGYVPDKFQGIPRAGFTAMMEKMVYGAEVRTRTYVLPGEGDIFTGSLDEFEAGLDPLRWVGREFSHFWSRVNLPHAVVNYCTADVPIIRAYQSHLLNTEYITKVSVEMPGRAKMYPFGSDTAAREYTERAWSMGIILLGRGARYKYADMDVVVRDVMDTLKIRGLI